MLLLIDNYDSFTYILKDLLAQSGEECLPVRNDELRIDEIREMDLNGIVISPGPGKPKDAGTLMKLIEVFHTKLPILGICLGQQAIGELFGAKLVKAKEPVHGKTSNILFDQKHLMFAGISEPMTVTRYHSLLLQDIPPASGIKITSKTSSGEIMSIAHESLPVWGFQFHPEAILTEYGALLIRNWLSYIKVGNALSLSSLT